MLQMYCLVKLFVSGQTRKEVLIYDTELMQKGMQNSSLHPSICNSKSSLYAMMEVWTYLKHFIQYVLYPNLYIICTVRPFFSTENTFFKVE